MHRDGSSPGSQIVQIVAASLYRFRLIALDGTLLRERRVLAGDDHEATRMAKAMHDGRVIELWEGVRFIARFEPSGD